ncbi:MAG: MAPEG family protein [Gammaproteobacteria bacterium]
MDMVFAVIGLALIEFMVFGLLVGAARVKQGIEAPAVSGDPIFERTYRIHYNTMEMLVVFIPAIWMFAKYIDPLWASMLGVIYLIGRILYYLGYIADPKKRAPGFGLSWLPTVILLLGGSGGAIMSVITG